MTCDIAHVVCLIVMGFHERVSPAMMVLLLLEYIRGDDLSARTTVISCVSLARIRSACRAH